MELVGAEKRIQALFSEARLADEQSAPSFAKVWRHAQAGSYRPHKAFNLAFVAATALLVCALVSLAWWSMRGRTTAGVAAIIPTTPVAAPAHSETNPRPGPVSIATVRRSTAVSKSFVIKVRPRPADPLMAADQKATREAKEIATWQSPTATLLDSSSDSLLKSLPQMNQTVDEMKSFLPNQPE